MTVGPDKGPGQFLVCGDEKQVPQMGPKYVIWQQICTFHRFSQSPLFWNLNCGLTVMKTIGLTLIVSK